MKFFSLQNWKMLLIIKVCNYIHKLTCLSSNNFNNTFISCSFYRMSWYFKLTERDLNLGMITRFTAHELMHQPIEQLLFLRAHTRYIFFFFILWFVTFIWIYYRWTLNFAKIISDYEYRGINNIWTMFLR